MFTSTASAAHADLILELARSAAPELTFELVATAGASDVGLQISDPDGTRIHVDGPTSFRLSDRPLTPVEQLIDMILLSDIIDRAQFESTFVNELVAA